MATHRVPSPRRQRTDLAGAARVRSAPPSDRTVVAAERRLRRRRRLVRVLDRGDLTCRRDRRLPSMTSKWGDGVFDDGSSRPGKDDAAVDSVALSKRRRLKLPRHRV